PVTGMMAHSNGWTIAMGPSAGRSPNAAACVVDIGSSYALYCSNLTGHFDIGAGVGQDARWVEGAAYADGGLAQVNTTDAPIKFETQPPFAGAGPGRVGPVIQYYPAGGQFQAPAAEKFWSLNQRHASQITGGAVTAVSGSLYTLGLTGMTV